ncbi:hypothetical protein D3C72_1406510 [compost metagenome]
MRIYPYHSGLNPPHQIHRLAEVIGPDTGGQAIGRIIHQMQELLFILKRHKAQHAGEGFFTHQRIVLTGGADHRRGHIEPLSVQHRTPTQYLVMAVRLIKHRLDAVKMRLVSQRTVLRGFVHRRTYLQRLDPGDNLLDNLVEARRMNIKPLGRGTNLPLMHQPGEHNAVHRPLGIDVGKKRRRVFSAQLQGDAGQIGFYRRLADRDTGRNRTGETDLIDPWMLDQPLPHLAFAIDHVEYARRHPGLMGQLRQTQQGQRCKLTGFDHDATPGAQGGCNFPNGDHHREIPGNNGRHHAHRLAVSHRGISLAVKRRD